MRADPWRYRWYGGRWWYWTPESRWMWYGDAGWTTYVPAAPTVVYSPGYRLLPVWVSLWVLRSASCRRRLRSAGIRPRRKVGRLVVKGRDR